MEIESARPVLLRLRVIALLTPLLVAACDQSTAEIVQEIDAAREGCTEEMLEASAEECVQMFEKYVDMGSDAIGTYIGAMKALDEALQRRPGLQFDTTGLGNAITPGFGTAPDSSLDSDRPVYQPYGDGDATRRRLGPSWRDETGRGETRPNGRGPQSAPMPDPGNRWADPTYDEPIGGSARPPIDSDDRTPQRRPTGTVAPTRRPQPPARGAILPPEERLHRPWIGDDEPPGQYTPEGAARSGDAPRPIPGPDVESSREPYRDPPHPF